MARALRLAEQGQYSVTPNPSVGCVIVSDTGAVVGEGFHKKAGTAHAEIHALAQAGELASKSTAYVTLEPCSHYGRTGPCALALIKAGIKKVVIAGLDPNPEVAGGGVKLLVDAGVTVACGLMQESAERLNRGFYTRMRTGRPYVRLKLAASLDGKTALQNGQSQWITSVESRRDVQIERARSCAILTGSGTALADNPRLNVRPNELPTKVAEAFALRGSQPLRVIVDGRNQLHKDLALISDGADSRIYNKYLAPDLSNQRLSQVQLPKGADEQHIDLSLLLDDLGTQQINNLWVEAGAKLAGALLDANLVDELILYMAPKILGGEAAQLVSSSPLSDLQDAINTHISTIKQIGPDIKIICQLR